MIDVLRSGIKLGAVSLDLFYGTPSPDNVKAQERHAANRFTVTRQLRYSRDATQRALDLCIFIIISTVQKFPFILDEIGSEHRGRTFAIIIDEAHSSQGGRTSAALAMALSEAGAEEDDESTEDKINRLMEAKKLLPNASYFAFTATPKNKTLEIFGEPYDDGGPTRHRPFHSYTMKQAIEDGFILDVVRSYTPVASYYNLVKTVAADPEFDTKRAQKKLRRYVESHDQAIRLKAEIMADHFHDQAIGLGKIGGQARAMVITSGVERAIRYYHAIRAYLAERKSPYQANVAFSGEQEYAGAKVTEASLNGFPGSAIADRIQEDPFRILVCADKFQTGYDPGQQAVRLAGTVRAARPGRCASASRRRRRSRPGVG